MAPTATTPDARTFVRAVIEQLGLGDNPRQPARKPEYRGASELAKVAGVSYQTVKRWLDGEREPEYEQTMRMIQACGWYTEAATQPRQAELDEDALARLESRMDAALNNQKKVLAELKRLGRIVAAGLPVEKAPAARSAEGTR